MAFKEFRDRNGLPIIFAQEDGGTSDLVFDRKGAVVGSLDASGTRDAQGRLLSIDRAPGLLARRDRGNP